jgi:hypothetical protein
MTSIDSAHHLGDPEPAEGEGPHSVRSGRWIPARHVLAPLAVFLLTLFLRMLVVGGPPSNDEGYYAFNADLAWRGAGIFQISPINFYPPLVRWAGMPPATPFLYLRIVDAFVAAGASVMLYFFLLRWSDSPSAFVMASGWAIAWNFPYLIEAGFRNSIMAATFAYLGALRILSARSRWSPFWAGLLIPIAVFLREASFPIVIVSLYLAATLHGRRGLMVHVAGLAAAGCALLIWLDLFRGPPLEILRYYRVEIPMYYDALTGWREISVERWGYFRIVLRLTMWLMPPALLSVGWLLTPARDERVAKGLAIILFLPPLYEIFAKYCVHYHWAQLLLGVAFLGAKGLHWLISSCRSSNRGWLMIGGLVAVAWLAGELDSRTIYRAYRDGFRLNREFSPVMIRGRWDDPSVQRSRFLEIAKFIRDRTTPDDRIVVSAYLHSMYPLTGRLPPSTDSADLFLMSTMRYPVNRPEVVEMLRRHPPRLVLENPLCPVPLTDFWPDFESRYRLARTFPEDPTKYNGNLRARVWELKE